MYQQFSRYRSTRVESLATHFLKKACGQTWFPDLDDDEARIMVNSCDLKTAVRTIKKNSQLRHKGKFGPLEDHLQKKLNLKIAMYDMLNKPAQETTALIAQVVKENDEFLAQKKKLDLNQEFISDLIKGVEEFDSGFSWFLRKTDNLYNIRKNKLRRAIINDEEFKNACQALTDIFTRHIHRAVDLAKERSIAAT